MHCESHARLPALNFSLSFNTLEIPRETTALPQGKFSSLKEIFFLATLFAMVERKQHTPIDLHHPSTQAARPLSTLNKGGDTMNGLISELRGERLRCLHGKTTHKRSVAPSAHNLVSERRRGLKRKRSINPSLAGVVYDVGRIACF